MQAQAAGRRNDNRLTAERAFDDEPFRVDVATLVSRHRPLTQSPKWIVRRTEIKPISFHLDCAPVIDWNSRRLGVLPCITRQGVMTQNKSIEERLSDLRAGASPSALPNQGKNFEHLSDRSVLQLYESIRHQVEADRAMGGKYRLVGTAAKQRAEQLQAELVQRELKFKPIVWLDSRS